MKSHLGAPVFCFLIFNTLVIIVIMLRDAPLKPFRDFKHKSKLIFPGVTASSNCCRKHTILFPVNFTLNVL